MTDYRLLFSQAPVTGTTAGSVKGSPYVQKPKTSTAFDQVLEQEIKGPLKFSSHAQQRLMSRGIKLEASDLEKMTQAMEQARQKGAKESLFLMDEVAFVVSIKNSTVITAVDKDSLKDNVFTNIDSAVIL